MTRSVPWGHLAPAGFLFLLPIAHTTPARIACLVLSIVWVVVAQRRRVPAGRPAAGLVAALLFWIGVCLAATIVSIEPAYSRGEFRNEVMSTMAAFGVFYFATDDAHVLRRWLAVLLASFAVVACIATVSYLVGVDWSREGFVGDRNAFSTYIVLIVPFLLLQWQRAAGRAPAWRIGIAAALVLALVSGAFTQNRNMWFAIAVEAVVFTSLVWRRLPVVERRRLRARVLWSGVVATVLLAATLTYVVQQKAAVSRTSIEEQARFDRDPRFEIWVYAAERIRERPWFGYGYGRGILRNDFRTHFDNPLKWHGHNLVIDYVLEAGVFGGIAIVLLFGALAWQSARLYRDPTPTIWPTGAWTLAMLAGIALKVMTDDILVRDSSLLFWSVLGMTFGVAARSRSSRAAMIAT